MYSTYDTRNLPNINYGKCKQYISCIHYQYISRTQPFSISLSLYSDNRRVEFEIHLFFAINVDCSSQNRMKHIKHYIKQGIKPQEPHTLRLERIT